VPLFGQKMSNTCTYKPNGTNGTNQDMTFADTVGGTTVIDKHQARQTHLKTDVTNKSVTYIVLVLSFSHDNQ